MRYVIEDMHHSYRSRDTLSLLDEMYRIDRVYTKPNPMTVPLVENFSYGAYVAKYSDILKLANEEEISIQESLNNVIRNHQLRPSDVIVAIEEWRPYVDPDILYRFSNNYVVIPEINTPVYHLCEICMESFLETGDYSWLDFYVECPSSVLEADDASAKQALEKYNRIKANYDHTIQIMKGLKQNSAEYKQLQSRLAGMEQGMKRWESIAALSKTSVNQNTSDIDERRRIAGSTFQGKFEGDAAYAQRQLDVLQKRMARLEQKGKTGSPQYQAYTKQAEEMKQRLARSQNASKNVVADSEQGAQEKEARLNQIADKKERMQQSVAAKAALSDTNNATKITTPSAGKSNDGPSWWSQKWTALKNWWNNAGQADDKGHVGWFSNIVGKFKNLIGIGTNQQSAATNTTDKPKKDTTNEKPAQSAEKKEEAKSAEQTSSQPAANETSTTTTQTTEQKPAENKPAEQPKPEVNSSAVAVTAKQS